MTKGFWGTLAPAGLVVGSIQGYLALGYAPQTAHEILAMLVWFIPAVGGFVYVAADTRHYAYHVRTVHVVMWALGAITVSLVQLGAVSFLFQLNSSLPVTNTNAALFATVLMIAWLAPFIGAMGLSNIAHAHYFAEIQADANTKRR